jgi:FKBP-type peptidyl-prolyl cis-trans isomerase FklB
MSQYDSIEQKASYGIGRNMGDQLAQQAFAGLDIPALQQGLADALNGLEFAVSRDDINDAFQVITARMQEEQEAAAKAAAAEGEAFLADNAKRAEVKTTDSGLQYEVMVEGNGAVPVAGQSVRVHYHGTFTHGGVFDSSVARGQPAEFPVTGVIAGWVEALQMMPVGSKWKLYIPQDLAYGARGAGSIRRTPLWSSKWSCWTSCDPAGVMQTATLGRRLFLAAQTGHAFGGDLDIVRASSIPAM